MRLRSEKSLVFAEATLCPVKIGLFRWKVCDALLATYKAHKDLFGTSKRNKKLKNVFQGFSIFLEKVVAFVFFTKLF